MNNMHRVYRDENGRRKWRGGMRRTGKEAPKALDASLRKCDVDLVFEAMYSLVNFQGNCNIC